MVDSFCCAASSVVWRSPVRGGAYAGGGNVNRNVNGNVNRNVNRNVAGVGYRGGAVWAGRPGWYRWPAGGAIAAGAAIGFVSAASAAAWAGAPPSAGLCWYRSKPPDRVDRGRGEINRNIRAG
jgi:hypothetical protein